MQSLVRIGCEQHLIQLRDEGLLYMNALPYFWQCEGTDSVRGDHFDSVHTIRRASNVVVNFGRSSDGATFPMDAKYVEIREHPAEAHKTNIFCMFYYEHNVTPYPIDKRLLEFGAHALVVRDVGQFLDRMESMLKEQGVLFEARVVEYVPDDYAGEVGPFKKLKKFEYQSEWRVVCYGGPGGPRQLRIGSIADISELVTTSSL